MSIALDSVAWLAEAMLVSMGRHMAAMMANRKRPQLCVGCHMPEIIAPHGEPAGFRLRPLFFLKLQNSNGISAILVIHAVILRRNIFTASPRSQPCAGKPSSF